MSGPKRNPDKLNTIGIVVVGICGAVLTYVSIVALQAFYMNDTSQVQATADYGGQETTARGHKAAEMQNITEFASNPAAGGGAQQTYRIPIDRAMKLVIDDAKRDPSHLVPALPASVKPTIEPIFGRPKPLGGTATPATIATGSGSGSGASGSGSGASGSGSGASGSGSGSAGSGSAGSGKAPAAAGGGNGH